MEMMIRDFSALRKISSDGIPERAILEELGLHELARLLNRNEEWQRLRCCGQAEVWDFPYFLQGHEHTRTVLEADASSA